MAPVTILEVSDLGNDLLRVRAETTELAPIGDGIDDTDVEKTVELEAFGHVSATTNHFDADAYITDPDAIAKHDELANSDDPFHRDPAATPRAMSPAEVGEYALRLIREQNPDVAEQQPAQPIPFEPAKEN